MDDLLVVFLLFSELAFISLPLSGGDGDVKEIGF